jgi:hypothetical protein
MSLEVHKALVRRHMEEVFVRPLTSARVAQKAPSEQ